MPPMRRTRRIRTEQRIHRRGADCREVEEEDARRRGQRGFRHRCRRGRFRRINGFPIPDSYVDDRTRRWRSDERGQTRRVVRSWRRRRPNNGRRDRRPTFSIPYASVVYVDETKNKTLRASDGPLGGKCCGVRAGASGLKFLNGPETTELTGRRALSTTHTRRRGVITRSGSWCAPIGRPARPPAAPHVRR